MDLTLEVLQILIGKLEGLWDVARAMMELVEPYNKW